LSKKALEKWSGCQEKEYKFQKEDADGEIMIIPHQSLHFWSSFCAHYDLSSVSLAIDVGCGRQGTHLLNNNIVGLDSLPFKSQNFVLGVAEHFPFRKVPLIFCFNTLDHMSNPFQALKEMLSSSDLLILGVYTTRPLFRLFVDWRDRVHPYHFTPKEVEDMLSSSGAEIVFKTQKSHLSYLPFVKGLTWKFLFFFNFLIGIRFTCYHLQRRKRNT
jgi:hypothetical protein